MPDMHACLASRIELQCMKCMASTMYLKLMPAEGRRMHVQGDDAEIMADFEGDWGDRRQELVFIGISLKTTEIIKALDACLATPEDVLKVSRSVRFKL